MNRTFYMIIILLICVVSLVSFVLDDIHHEETEGEKKKFIYIMNKSYIDKIKNYENKKFINFKNNIIKPNRVQCYKTVC